MAETKMIIKDLGEVTAYAYAVSKGYTGTESEFAELMASYATVGQEAVDAALAAESARDTAQSTVAGAIAGIQAEGQTQIGAVRSEGTTQVGNVNTAGQTQVSAVQTKGEEVLNSIPADYTALSEDVDDLKSEMTSKAEVDGYYQDMTVGDAEQLVSSQFVEDNAPYKFRTSGGSADIGNRAYVDKIVGGTIAWNQRMPIYPGNAYSLSSASGTKEAFTPTAQYGGVATSLTNTLIKDHKYLAAATIKSSKNTVNMGNNDGSSNNAVFITGNGTWETVYKIFISNRTGSLYWFVRDNDLSDFAEINVKNPQLFDLTQMFGSTIADAIYAMEQATAGAGVAWFRKLFPNDYYDYNAGELISVSGLQSHDMVGFNLVHTVIDGELVNRNTGEFFKNAGYARTDYIPVLPGVPYYQCESNEILSEWAAFYDADKNFISGTTINNKTVFIPPNGAVFYCTTMQIRNKNSICINLSHNGSRNDEYEPYAKHSYPLDSSLTLRGIPKLSADNQLYFDGDEYLPEGKVNRRYGIRTFAGESGESWGTASGTLRRFVISPNDIKTRSGSTAFLVCDKFIPVDDETIGTIKQYNGQLWVYVDQSITTVADFKAWLANNPFSVVYELKTPTEETAEPYNEVQLVDDWGTEEYVSGTICPVGHETRYPANLRDKLQHLPDAASGNGSYLIQQTDGQMVLTPFPAPPSTAGNYVLKATVTNGVPTYTWEAAT